MQDDERCCGTGTCLINAEGFCWCGQQWDGEKMCFATPASAAQAPAPKAEEFVETDATDDRLARPANQ